MAEKKLPIVIDNYIRSECWTQILFSIIQTSENAPAWIASHIGIIGAEDMGCWYGNLSKIFSYRNALDILNVEEVNIWNVKPEKIVDFLLGEIDDDNYIVVELKRRADNDKGYQIHEQLIFGYDDEMQLFYGSILGENGIFKEITISFDEMYLLYQESYHHFQDPANKEEFIYWSRSNFLITRMCLRNDYRPQGCTYDFLQNMVIEADGKEHITLQYDGNKNIMLEKRMYSGVACLLAAEKRMDALLHDRHFIDKDTDIEYNDLFGQLAFKLAKDFYKLYEHRKIILQSLYWFYEITGVQSHQNSPHVKAYEKCCKEMDKYYSLALKFRHSRDWNVLVHLRDAFSHQYKKEHAALDALVGECKDIWYTSKQKI